MINAVAFLIPLFLFIAFVEWLVIRRKNNTLFSGKNTLVNLAIGAIDQTVSLFVFLLFYLVLDYVYVHYRFFTMQDSWLQWVLAYIAVDFVSYWYHRFSHKVNILWAGHITHHSSEYYNFTNGFRVSPFQGLNRIPFWTVLPLLGFSPVVIVLTFKISGVYDFFQHTQTIKKLGFLENILITPSIHRVHHGKNDNYIDKNYGSNFVIWDKLFGTFVEETEPVVYGIKSKEYQDNNPLNAIFYHYNYLWDSMKSIPGWKNKIKLLFMPPEWVPEDFKVPSNKGNRKKLKTTEYHKSYGIFQVISCALGVVTILAFREFLPLWEFVFFAVTFVIGMINAAKIFNNNLSKHFKTQEMARLILTLIIVCCIYLIQPEKYIVIGSIYLVLSLILTARMPFHSDEFVSDSPITSEVN